MSRYDDDRVTGYVLLAAIIWTVGSGIAEVWKIPRFWGCLFALIGLLTGCYAYALHERRKWNRVRPRWTDNLLPQALGPKPVPLEAEQTKRERERRQAEAIENAARTKWAEYHESKSLAQIAKLSGTQFEEFLARLFARMSYTEITLTATNDQGGDLLCVSPQGVLIVIQAKRWNSSVGNGAVQELLGAMLFYGREVGMVVTNSHFTAAAKELAGKHPYISLFDGNWLAERVKLYFPPNIPEFNWDDYNRVVRNFAPPRAKGTSKFKFRRTRRRR